MSRADLPNDVRILYLARLVPIALANATTLDLVLARLTLAMTPAGPLMLGELLVMAPVAEGDARVMAMCETSLGLDPRMPT